MLAVKAELAFATLLTLSDFVVQVKFLSYEQISRAISHKMIEVRLPQWLLVQQGPGTCFRQAWSDTARRTELQRLTTVLYSTRDITASKGGGADRIGRACLCAAKARGRCRVPGLRWAWAGLLRRRTAATGR